MMSVSFTKGRFMSKAAVLILLTVLSAFAGAQTPTNKNKAVASKATMKPKMSASEAATAALQAEAIAQAAALQPAAAAVGQAPGMVKPSTPTLASAPDPVKAQPGAAASASAPAALMPTHAGAPHDAVSAEELEIAKRVHQGHLACELGASIRVESDAAQPGYFNLQGKGFRYRMRPVVTSTGAIRLEDAKAGAVWLQLANKSMLMDQKKGRRVADECANSEQLAYAENMKTNPPPKLFDTTGMGR